MGNGISPALLIGRGWFRDTRIVDEEVDLKLMNGSHKYSVKPMAAEASSLGQSVTLDEAAAKDDEVDTELNEEPIIIDRRDSAGIIDPDEWTWVEPPSMAAPSSPRSMPLPESPTLADFVDPATVTTLPLTPVLGPIKSEHLDLLHSSADRLPSPALEHPLSGVADEVLIAQNSPPPDTSSSYESFIPELVVSPGTPVYDESIDLKPSAPGLVALPGSFLLDVPPTDTLKSVNEAYPPLQKHEGQDDEADILFKQRPMEERLTPRAGDFVFQTEIEAKNPFSSSQTKRIDAVNSSAQPSEANAPTPVGKKAKFEIRFYGLINDADSAKANKHSEMNRPPPLDLTDAVALGRQNAFERRMDGEVERILTMIDEGVADSACEEMLNFLEEEEGWKIDEGITNKSAYGSFAIL